MAKLDEYMINIYFRFRICPVGGDSYVRHVFFSGKCLQDRA